MIKTKKRQRKYCNRNHMRVKIINDQCPLCPVVQANQTSYTVRYRRRVRVSPIKRHWLTMIK